MINLDSTITIWLAVDRDGREFLFKREPYWRERFNIWDANCGWRVSLPVGTIKKLLGRDITVEDGAVSFEGNEFPENFKNNE